MNTWHEWLQVLPPEELLQQLTPERADTGRILDLVRRKSGRYKRYLPRRVIALTAALAVLACTAVAAVVFEWDQKLLAFLQPSQTQQEQLQLAGQQVDRKVTQNGVTVEVDQVVGDSYSAYALCRIRYPQKYQNVSQLSFSQLNMRIDMVGYSGGGGLDQIEIDPQSKEAVCLLRMSHDQPIRGQKVTLSIEDITLTMTDPETGEVTKVKTISGSWQLSWTLRYQDVADGVQKLDLPGQIEGHPVYIEDFYYSDFMVRATLRDGKYTEMHPQVPDGSYVDAIKVTMKDGRVLQPRRDYLDSTVIHGGRCAQITVLFTEMIEPGQIASIEIAGQQMPLS